LKDTELLTSLSGSKGVFENAEKKRRKHGQNKTSGMPMPGMPESICPPPWPRGPTGGV